ncbi:MAG: hypothetical protein WBZ37_10075 [Mycobacterium sp.]
MAEHDHPSNPGTEPFVPEFDTGTNAFVPDFDDTGEDSVPFVPDFSDIGDTGSQPSLLPLVGEPEPTETPETPSLDAAPVHSVTVPGRYQYLNWWKLLLVILGVWIAAAEVGLSLFYWWYHTVDKTAVLFIVLVYVVACVVGGVMLAMVQGRPLIAALSIAVMSGPFASAAAAAPLYGYYYCARATQCVVGIIPY